MKIQDRSGEGFMDKNPGGISISGGRISGSGDARNGWIDSEIGEIL